MLLKNKLEKFKQLLNSDNVLTNLEERYCYSSDASNMLNKNQVPDLVIFVETVEEVQKILKYANEHKIPVIARGAGTNMVGACICTSGGIVLNFSKMNKIIEINPTDMYAIVQPGVILGDLKKRVNDIGLFFPPDPSNYKVSTIGGAIAQSSGGAMSFKYGTTKDYILSLKVVTAEGKLLTLGARTTKETVGYHLNQLIIGSEGTLAIVVEATLKLIPKPETKRSLIAYFNNVADSISAVNEIIRGQIFPCAIDFMDNNSIFTVEQFKHSRLNTSASCMLLIEVDGLESNILEQLKKIEQIITPYNAFGIEISKTDEENERLWEARRVSYAAATRLAPDVVSDDIIVPRSNLSKMIQKCQEISEKYNIKICLVGHIGDGNLHPQFVLNLDNEIEFRNYIQAKSELYETALSLQGSISAEHGIGLEKIEYVQKIVDNEVLEYMKMIKKIFDPNNILNPGKIFK